MGAQTLFTLLALLLAVFAVLPPERRLDLRLRLKPLDWSVAATALFLIHYIQFYPVLSRIGLAPNLGPWRWGFDPENASYFIALVATVFIWLRARTATVGPSAVGALNNLVERLLFEGRYSEVLFLFERHHKALVRLCTARRQSVTFEISLREASEAASSVGEGTPIADGPAIEIVGETPPPRKKLDTTACQTLRRLLQHEAFVAYMAKARPYFCLNVLDADLFEREDCLGFYIKALLTDKTSVLYGELPFIDNWNSDPQATRLIGYFLLDAKVAEQLAAWKPFGKFSLDYLDAMFRDPASDTYNLDLGSYYEEGRWRCPLYASLRFFEEMVSAALHQGIQWHMWLFYFPPLVARICRNLAPEGRMVDLTREWPTPYHHLLYEAFRILTDWIEEAKEIPPEQSNVKLASDRADHENGNIPKSAAIALADSLRHVMLAESVDARFRAYLLDTVLHTYFGLGRLPTMQPLRRVMRDLIVQGGSYCSDESYYASLAAALGRVDKIAYLGAEFDELVQMVNARLSTSV